uniref:Serine aminopeptidase S33 domain-containing protein n=1 Tax=Panagrolaimus sp. PS1159 TaxID=55785 RepID=A0AC35G5A7_9BILA
MSGLNLQITDFTNEVGEQRHRCGKDPKKSKKTVEDFKPKPPPLIQRAITGTLSTIVCAYNKIAVCTGCKIPPPAHLIDSFAFYPPAPWKWYYLSYFNEEIGKRSFGNAKQCYGKPSLRIEPVTDSKNKALIAQIETFAERTQAFIIQSESGNYIVGAKIEAELSTEEEPSHKVILLANSNACDLGLSLNCYAGYIASYQHPDAYDVYTFDYSGYGLSTGKPNENAVYKDIEGVYDYIVTERKDPKLEIILIGISIGTAVVTDLAAKNFPYVSGVVLIAPLTSAIRHVSRHHPPRVTSPYVDCFRTIDKVPSVNVPLLCIHGLNDEMMPPSNSAEIYAVAPYGVDPLFLPNRCHLGVLSSFRLGERIITFMEEDIEKWKAGFQKDKLHRTSHMKYEEFEYDKDTDSDKSPTLTTETPTS